MASAVDLTGKRFGALTVVEKAPSKNRYIMWACRCDCGKDHVVAQVYLLKGLVTSCGCGICRHTRRQVDYTGRTFWNLTAIRRIVNGKWLWRCTCGNETVATAANVKKGITTSCGCVRREASEKRITKDNVLQHYEGTCVTMIRKITSGKLRSNNRSGYTGVSIRHNVACDVYVATIMVKKRKIHLGTFADMASAIAARKDAERKYFGKIISEYDAEHQTDEEGGADDGQ